jgi:ATP-dependent exoDNAse (exonuclease V) beta subunit
MGLKLYKASAGSGKTYTMAVEIIAVLLMHPDAYRHTLAITFTNKAAGELKTRVVSVLAMLADGDKSKGYYEKIQKKTGLPDHKILSNAKTALKFVLHDYSRLSISTIDRFFNRILASFSYELNIRPDSEISLDDDINREEALDELLSGFDINAQLGKWLLNYARTNIEDDKNWNIRDNLLKDSHAITKETFLDNERSLKLIYEDKSILEDYRETIFAIIESHNAALRTIGELAQQELLHAGLSISDFKYNKSGAVGFLLSLRSGFRDITGRALDAVDEPMSMLTKTDQKNPDRVDLCANKLHPLLVKAVQYMQQHEQDYFTALAIKKDINSFGVLLDINQELRRICAERHIYFPAQMSQLLHEIVSLDNALFVYEKMGTRYKHYFLDEFQDTSGMQWSILRPLLEESLAGGGETMIVGDVKQSIYRWRNGDWNLLSSQVEKELPGVDNKTLDHNFRSRPNVIRFNNHLTHNLIPLFQNAATADSEPTSEMNLSKLYDAYRQIPFNQDAPYGEVKFHFINDDKEEEKDWKQIALDEMVDEMKALQDKGYSPGDMAVLTRKNDEAAAVALRLMKEDQQTDYHFPVVSAASLKLTEHPAIQLLLEALRWIDNPDDHIALSAMVHTWQIDILNNKSYQPNLNTSGDYTLVELLIRDLPAPFQQQYQKLTAWPLYDLAENLIHWFKLDEKADAVAFLNTFQDNVLSYSERNPVEIAGFLKWFEQKNVKLDMPDAADAVVISTVHKAKGLEFRFVFIPMTDWPVINTRGAKLWVEPQTEPFNALPLVIVDAVKNLKRSHFVKEYQQEVFNQHVDMLNILYVAVTRAEEGLYLWGPTFESKNKSGPKRACDFLHLAISNATNPVEDANLLSGFDSYFDDENNVFHLGDVPVNPESGKGEELGINLNNYNVNIRENSFRYHHPDAFLNLEQDEQIRHKTTAGSVCHAVLETVRTVDDIPEAIENVVRSGRISRAEAADYESLIENAVAGNPVRQWFDAEAHVINEQDILLPDGGFIKPDRVVLKNDKPVVIDYKFGKRKSQKSHEQVKHYMSALRDMGYDRVTGYIWYVFLQEVEEVTI